MSILIKGMGMPKERESFTLTIKYNGLVVDTETGIQVAEAQEVPPHGRLIDADALTEAIELIDWYHQNKNKDMVAGANSDEHQAWYREQDIYKALDDAPTIIEAEEES